MRLFFTLLVSVCLIANASAGNAQSLSEDDLVTAQMNFKNADSDAGGHLTLAEFEVFVNANAEAKIGRSPMIKRMGMYGRAFDRIDANDDDRVTWDEFRTAVAEENS